ncbi:dihydrodipicolinate synthase [Colletotrichum costaricense]|uniref:Dihydrodipicolinate synthase n=1 Tax=Colletotrichum costaricense TaxID=1209916 RepID=A0AAI9YNW4_9PEZI|nr:dihydrodipicolinate synthase [Colletotrichum costaricense]KAK1517936.1 dihydrodipicolinate synthase [Colletotrichum costaricense]
MSDDSVAYSSQAEASQGAPKAKHLRLPNGVYAPTLAFLSHSEDIDTVTLEHHVTRLIKAGVVGIVIHSSIGEAVHLTREERSTMIRCAADTISREYCDRFKNTRAPLIAACGAQSTRGTLQLCRDAAESGAPHAFIIVPSYYASVVNNEMIIQHFYDVADRSPIPLVIDNFPAAVSGMQLTLDDILRIARHPNVMGVNFKYDNMKILGANGTIAGLANFATYACVRVRGLSDRGEFLEAQHLQAVNARGNSVVTGLGLVGTKAVVNFWNDYGGAPRKPCYLPPLVEVIKVSEELSELFRADRSPPGHHNKHVRDQDEAPTIKPMREAAVTARKMGFRPEQRDLSSGGVAAARAVSD